MGEADLGRDEEEEFNLDMLSLIRLSDVQVEMPASLDLLGLDQYKLGIH